MAVIGQDGLMFSCLRDK